jgi:hypothetical protein
MDIDVRETLLLTLIFLFMSRFFPEWGGVETDFKLIEILPNLI